MREMLEMLNIFEILLKNPSATVELKLWILEEKKTSPTDAKDS